MTDLDHSSLPLRPDLRSEVFMTVCVRQTVETVSRAQRIV